MPDRRERKKDGRIKSKGGAHLKQDTQCSMFLRYERGLHSIFTAGATRATPPRFSPKRRPRSRPKKTRSTLPGVSGST